MGDSGAEDLLELERRGLLELVVAAVGRLLVRSPSLEGGGVPEPIALEMVVGDLRDALDAQRLPRQGLATVPARRRPGQPLAGLLGRLGPLGPLAPRVALECLLAERRQLLREGGPPIPGERAGDADRVQRPGVVEQPE